MFVILSILVAATCALETTLSPKFDDILVRFVIDATPSFFPPTGICLYWCASEENLVYLSRELSKRYIPHTIQNIINKFDGQFCDDSEQHQVLSVLDLHCTYAKDVIRQASSSRMFGSPQKWLIFQSGMGLYNDNGTNDADNDVIETFGTLEIYPDSDVLLARRFEDSFLNLTAFYRPSPYKGIFLEDRGNWTISHGIRKRDNHPASRRRRNLHLTPLKSCLAMTDPDTINHLTDYYNNRVDPTPKSNYQWVLHLISRINATISFNVTDIWGYPDKNGSWNGMIGMLQRREIDFGGTGIYFIPQRLDVVDYIQLYTKTGSRFVFKKPLLSTVSNIFILPFQRTVWIAIGIFLVLVFCLLYLSMKWEFYQGATDKSGTYWAEMNANEPTVGDDFLIIIGAVAQQGYSYEPYRVPSRIVTFMLLIAVLSLYAAYTANIVALLQSTTDSISTFTDLVNSPLKLGVHDLSYHRQFFKDSGKFSRSHNANPVGIKLSWMTMEDGVQRIKEGLFAFHGEVGIMYKIMQDTYQEDEKCGLTEINFLQVPQPLFVVQKHSPYTEIFKNWALIMRESGLKMRDEYRLFTNKPTCHGQTSFISIGLTECYFALATICWGLVLAALTLLLELVWYRSLSASIRDAAKLHYCLSNIVRLFF